MEDSNIIDNQGNINSDILYIDTNLENQTPDLVIKLNNNLINLGIDTNYNFKMLLLGDIPPPFDLASDSKC